MKECKPCIQIRTVIKLLWKNYIVEATHRFREDYRSNKMIGAVTCTLAQSSPKDMTPDSIVSIRKMAMESYNPNQAI